MGRGDITAPCTAPSCLQGINHRRKTALSSKMRARPNFSWRRRGAQQRGQGHRVLVSVAGARHLPPNRPIQSTQAGTRHVGSGVLTQGSAGSTAPLGCWGQ